MWFEKGISYDLQNHTMQWFYKEVGTDIILTSVPFLDNRIFSLGAYFDLDGYNLDDMEKARQEARVRYLESSQRAEGARLQELFKNESFRKTFEEEFKKKFRESIQEIKK